MDTDEDVKRAFVLNVENVKNVYVLSAVELIRKVLTLPAAAPLVGMLRRVLCCCECV